MLRARLETLLQPLRPQTTPVEAREAYHSDLRELLPEAWSRRHPRALGSDVERAMMLAGIGSRDFARVVKIDLSPHVAVPVDDIVSICQGHARTCTERARRLRAALPRPNPWGRPALPIHRAYAREAEQLQRSAEAWSALAGHLVSNRWNLD